jgi:O-antigen ligase
MQLGLGVVGLALALSCLGGLLGGRAWLALIGLGVPVLALTAAYLRSEAVRQLRARRRGG